MYFAGLGLLSSSPTLSTFSTSLAFVWLPGHSSTVPRSVEPDRQPANQLPAARDGPSRTDRAPRERGKSCRLFNFHQFFRFSFNLSLTWFLVTDHMAPVRGREQ